MDHTEQALEPQFEQQRMICACPQCDQWLELHEDHLDQAEGWVRCVRCEQVFLGLACLVEEEQHAGDAPLNASPYASARGQGSIHAAAMGDGAQSADQSADHSKPLSLDEFLYQRTLQNNKPAASQVQQGPVRQSPLGAKALALAREEVKAHPRKRSWGWAWLAALMVLGAVPLGFTLRFKNEVAALYPSLKPPLVKMCQALNCEVEWPRDLSALSIESSALEKEDLSDKEGRAPAQSGSSSNMPSPAKRFAYHLSLRIKNSFSYPVALPKVKLTLLDEKDQVLQVRTLVISVPQDPQVIRPGGLNPFVMPIDLEDAKILAPNGYRVELE
jgi:predicted Zn finger-like uncharacterized protein